MGSFCVKNIPEVIPPPPIMIHDTATIGIDVPEEDHQWNNAYVSIDLLD